MDVTQMHMCTVTYLMNSDYKDFLYEINIGDDDQILHSWVLWHFDDQNMHPFDTKQMTPRLSIFIVIRQKYISRFSIMGLNRDRNYSASKSLVYSMVGDTAYVNNEKMLSVIQRDFSSFKHDDYYLSDQLFFGLHESVLSKDKQLYLHVIDVKSLQPKNRVEFSAVFDEVKKQSALNPIDMRRWYSIPDIEQPQKIMLISRIGNDLADISDVGEKFTVFATDNPTKKVSYTHYVQYHNGNSLVFDFMEYDCVMIIGLDKPFVYTPEIGKINLDGLPKFVDVMKLISSFDDDVHPSLYWIEYLIRKDISMRLDATIDTPLTYVNEYESFEFAWGVLKNVISERYEQLTEYVMKKVVFTE